MMKSHKIMHRTPRFAVTVSDDSVKLTTNRGDFTFGVDNDGFPYISTITRNLVISPSASNRARIYEEPRPRKG